MSTRDIHSVGTDIWIVDGPKIPFLIWSIPTRMTVVRLPSGELWVHSPVAISPSITDWLSALGSVAMIVAPNKFHHLFLSQWIKAYPNALVFAAPGLGKKRADIGFHDDLTDTPPQAWRGHIDQIMFTGNRLFDEVVFYHLASKTLILTDLIVNVRVETYAWHKRWLARLDGLAFPDGGTPTIFKLLMRNKTAGRKAVRRMLDWEPQSVVISHGEWFDRNGTAEIRRRFDWLLAE